MESWLSSGSEPAAASDRNKAILGWSFLAGEDQKESGELPHRTALVTNRFGRSQCTQAHKQDLR
ncbi:MAG: hypothetical protein ACK6BG_15520 [Cyanobacteriota bacterium]